MNNPKLTYITSGMTFEKVLDDIRDGLRDSTIIDVVIVASQDMDNNVRRIHRYWYSGKNTSTYVLGLLEYMKAVIINWIFDQEDE